MDKRLNYLKEKVGFILAGVYIDGTLDGASGKASTTYHGAVEATEKIHALYAAEMNRHEEKEEAEDRPAEGTGG